MLDPWQIGLLGGLPFAILGMARVVKTECPDCGARMPTIRKPANMRQALWGGWTCPNCGCECDRWGARVHGGPAASASDPGGLTVSEEKLRVLRPDLYGFSGFRHKLRVSTGLDWPQKPYLEAHLRDGDSRAAVVVSTEPLRVAAYTDELDCVAILEYPDEFVDDYALRVGSRLLTINSYNRARRYDRDLVRGPNDTQRWTGFHPIIAEFVSDDDLKINARKSRIGDDEWQRAYRLGRAYIKQRPDIARDGRPIFAAVSADMDEDDDD